MSENLEETSRLKPYSDTPGFTLIEVLVVLAVIGLLAGLIIPAAFSAREAARKARCANNLHQLGLALASYTSSFGSFPNDSNGMGFSVLVTVLPYLDQAPIFSGINFQVSPQDIGPNNPNNTLFSTQVAVFLCPLEQPPLGHFGGGASYAGNRGVSLRNGRDNGTFNGGQFPPTKYGDFRDGTSSTAAMSEWVIGPGAPALRDPRGSIFETPDSLTGPQSLPAFQKECMALDPATASVALNDKGDDWMLGGYAHTIYNHNLPINSRSCTSEGFICTFRDFVALQIAIFPEISRGPGISVSPPTHPAEGINPQHPRIPRRFRRSAITKLRKVQFHPGRFLQRGESPSPGRQHAVRRRARCFPRRYDFACVVAGDRNPGRGGGY